MKRIFLVLIVISVVLSALLLISCGGDQPDTTTTGSKATSSPSQATSAGGTTNITTTAVTTTAITTTPVTTVPPIYYNTEWDGKSLKVLAIGNSFSVDSMTYLYDIAKAEGVEEIILGNLYIGGCSLQTHANTASSGSASYKYYKNTTGEWTETPSVSMWTALKDEEWDIVTLQQASGVSGVEKTYLKSQIQIIANAVKKNVPNEKVRMAWHMTWAYQSTSTHSEFVNYSNNQKKMYTSILSAVKNKITVNDNFAMIIPSGTAIQNARTSYVGDALTRDGYHLNDLGRFISGYMWYFTLTGTTPSELKCSPEALSLFKEDLEMIREAVTSAFNTPFENTKSTYKTRPELDLSDYVQIEFDYTVGAYWNPTLDAKYNILITDAGNSPYFIATELFSKETLPVGSVIVIDEGWQYRPDAWKDNAKQASRPAITSQKYVKVTESYWEGYKYRAFNIAVLGAGKNITNDPTAYTHFRIYVPKGTVIPDVKVEFEKEEAPEINLDDYVLLEYDYTRGAYWYCTHDTKHNELISGKKYVATQKFTREDLPIGTIIMLDEGWKYRPEGWLEGDAAPSSRPPLTSEAIVIIDEEWWGEFETRAFNLSLAEAEDLSDDPDAYTHLRIYIPKSAISE